MFHYKRSLKTNARKLRGSLTDAERRLWSRLRGKQLHGVQVFRQKPLGPYIVDFHIPSCRLVIELDGGQHAQEANLAADAARDAVLGAMGETVLRFSNDDVLQHTDGVVQRIYEAVAARLRESNPPQSPFF